MAENYLDRSGFWKNSESCLFLNPRLPKAEAQSMERAAQLEQKSGVIWLKTSGTEMSQQGEHKLVALKKEAILHAAKSVNEFFNLNKKDKWLNTLPHFHIGGIAIYARSYLSGSEVIDFSDQAWEAISLVDRIQSYQATLTSLVPTQIYDIVDKQLQSPTSLRFAFVGGGALDKSLYLKARDLGWPLILSYGMTETSAMLAASRPESLKSTEYPDMETLPHIQIEQKEETLSIRTPSLLSGYLFVSPKGKRWVPVQDIFHSDDRVFIDGKKLSVLGRSSDLVKILGETVDIQMLEEKFRSLYASPFAIVARSEERKGFELILVSEGEVSQDIIQEFNDRVMPYERLQGVKKLEKLPRTELGKIKRKEILDQLDRKN